MILIDSCENKVSAGQYLAFDQISGSSTVVTLGPEGEVHAKAKLGHTLTPDGYIPLTTISDILRK